MSRNFSLNSLPPPTDPLHHSSCTSAQLTELIRDERQRQAINLEELARLTGLEMIEVQAVMSAPISAPLSNVYAVANALNLDPEHVLDLLNSAHESHNAECSHD